jgi:hypothetical protein
VNTAAGGSANGVKRYVNLRVRIDPQDDTNPVNLEHTFMVSITQNLGNGQWVPVTNGVTATISILPTPAPAGFSLVSNSCATGTTSGLCTVVINSSIAAVYEVNASVTTNVAGQSITRSTLGDSANIAAGGSDSAFKTYREGALTVEKTVNTYYTRTFTWDIEKVVDPNSLRLFDGESLPVTYTVVVTKGAGTDSDHYIDGQVTISNTSVYPVNIVSIVDALDGVTPVGLNCSGPVPGTLAGNGELVCTYSYIPTTDAAFSATNLVTVTTSSGVTATGQAPVVFGSPTITINNGITVTDSNLPGVVYGPYTATDEFEYVQNLTCETRQMSE